VPSEFTVETDRQCTPPKERRQALLPAERPTSAAHSGVAVIVVTGILDRLVGRRSCLEDSHRGY
jgi:hypothetical protein